MMTMMMMHYFTVIVINITIVSSSICGTKTAYITPLSRTTASSS